MKNAIYMISIMMILVAAGAYAVEITSPRNEVYNTADIKLQIETEFSADRIEYSVDSGPIVLACENCDSYEKNLVLSEGMHDIRVFSYSDDELEYAYVNLTVQVKEDFKVMIIMPEDKIYRTAEIKLKIRANKDAEYINYSLDGVSLVTACTNCSTFAKWFNLTEGEHSFRAVAKSGDELQDDEVGFFINLSKDPKNKSLDNPRFGIGFQHLPKIVEEGGISDEDLAGLIRDNKLNPGVLNRLIKTGKLGNESIEAILDTQWNPPGILMKFLSFVGFRHSTVAEEVYRTYGVPNHLGEKILKRDDLHKKSAEQIKEQVKERNERIRIQADEKDRSMIRMENTMHASKERDTFRLGKQDPPAKSKSVENPIIPAKGKPEDVPRGNSEGKGRG